MTLASLDQSPLFNQSPQKYLGLTFAKAAEAYDIASFDGALSLGKMMRRSMVVLKKSFNNVQPFFPSEWSTGMFDPVVMGQNAIWTGVHACI